MLTLKLNLKNNKKYYFNIFQEDIIANNTNSNVNYWK
jgi:hypothetical protein